MDNLRSREDNCNGFTRVAITKYHFWENQFSRLWRLEVQDQGAGALVSFSSSFFAEVYLLLPYHTTVPLYKCTWCFCVLIYFSYENDHQIEFESTLMPHFDLITSLKILSPNLVHSLRYLVLSYPHMNFRDIIHPITPI